MTTKIIINDNFMIDFYFVLLYDICNQTMEIIQMKLREKIDSLMRNAKIDTYKDLLIRMYKQLGDNSAYEKAEREKGNFTKMLNGERELNSKYYIPIERIFDIRIADLLSDDANIKPSYRNRGLRYTAAANTYEEFANLAAETSEGAHSVIFNTDEYNKSIFDYIIEFRATNGIRYLVDELSLRYECLRTSFCSPSNTSCFCYGENIDKIADVLFEADDGATFTKLFHAYDTLNNYYDDQRQIYGKESFIKRILLSADIFSKYLTMSTYALSEINHGLQNNDHNGIFINPILNKLLELAFDDPGKYADKIIAILNYGIENNPKVIATASECDDSGNNTFEIKDNGGVELRYILCGCVIVIKDDYINTDITSEMKEKISQIKEINNRILVRETVDVLGTKRLQRNKSGNVIKRHTDNFIEYEMYAQLKDIDLPISRLLSTKDGVDEFAAYSGKNNLYKYTSVMIAEIAKFLKKLHIESANILNGQVYVHGNICGENLYFEGDSLACVANWDCCHIGDVYENLSDFILNFSGVADKFRNNADVFKTIKYIFKVYGAGRELIRRVIKHIKDYLEISVSKLDFNSEQDIKTYETLKWCESFFDIYSQQLIEAEE